MVSRSPCTVQIIAEKSANTLPRRVFCYLNIPLIPMPRLQTPSKLSTKKSASFRRDLELDKQQIYRNQVCSFVRLPGCQLGYIYFEYCRNMFCFFTLVMVSRTITVIMLPNGF